MLVTQTVSTIPTTMADVLAPMRLSEFLSDYWTKSFLHQSGEADRFSGLCSWELVNSILDSSTLQPPQIKITKNGITVPPTQYIDFRDRDFPRVDPRGLLKQLQHGAMLEMNCVERTHESLRVLTANLHSMFNASTFAMIFANFRTAKGFNLHWDAHEVLVFQIDGRKLWKVYRPTLPVPLKTGHQQADMPTGEPVFEAIIEPGSFLYIPRGWWHVAYPLDEPSFHLSIGIRVPSGIDMLEWFAKHLRHSAIGRQDIPLSKEDRIAYAQELIAQINQTWSPELLDQFLDVFLDRSKPLTTNNLPDMEDVASI